MDDNKLKNYRREIRLEVIEAEKLLDDTRTNHVLHLLLTLITFGLWAFAWIVVAYTNNTKRTKLKEVILQGNRAISEIEDGFFR